MTHQVDTIHYVLSAPIAPVGMLLPPDCGGGPDDPMYCLGPRVSSHLTVVVVVVVDMMISCNVCDACLKLLF